jgi:hypothetical protein
MKTSIKFAVLSSIALALAAGQAAAVGCGAPGLPACDLPEPSSLPMMIGAIVIAAAVARARKK